MLPLIVAGIAAMLDHLNENHGADVAKEAADQIREALDEHPALQDD